MVLPANTLEALFVSKVRLKALKFFLLNPTREIHLRGAVREMNEEINAVRRELERLSQVDLILTESKGNRKYFKLNLAHTYINELVSLFHKSYGLGGDIIAKQDSLGQIEFAVLTPAFTKGIYFGNQIIDVLFVGEVNIKELQKLLEKAEDQIGREVNYSVLKPKELDLRRKRRDQFVTDIMLQDNVMLIGNHENFIK